MRFAKYHGTGNDFVMVEDLDDEVRLDARVIAAICDRHRGVGADGLIRVAPAESADFFMDYYNADGQVAEMCGNGLRCLAKLVYDRNFTRKREITVLTRAGTKHAGLEVEDGVVTRVTVDMGPPALERGAIPMTGDASSRFVGEDLQVDGRRFSATAVSMGNPHCVLLLDPSMDLAAIDVPRLGTLVEHRDEFPQRTNVEFITVEDGRVRVRVWERGSGETMACGTGACAALVASAVNGLTGRRADVEFPGGTLDVDWRDDDRVMLAGPAVKVFAGELEDAWLANAADGSASTIGVNDANRAAAAS